MWHTTHELSATQVHHPSINAYQQYSTTQIPHHHANYHNGNMGKWNVSGQRSSYSLPHPGHTQSNTRWSKYDEKPVLMASQTQPIRHLSNSTRNLATMPPSATYLHEQRQMYGSGLQRQRPASMYDTPNSMPNINYYNSHQYQTNGFLSSQSNLSKKEAKQQANAKNGSYGLRQSPGELVRRCFIQIEWDFFSMWWLFL